jgi:hypothetical protein
MQQHSAAESTSLPPRRLDSDDPRMTCKTKEMDLTKDFEMDLTSGSTNG